MPEIIGIVPARRGSKRIEHKNMRRLAGSPLIVWTLEPAVSSMVREVIVTSDDLELLALANLYEKVTTHHRDQALAGDGVPDLPVVEDVLERYERTRNRLKDDDIIVFLRPTAPFRRPSEINAVVKLLIESKADSVRSVYRAKWHPQKAYVWSEHTLVPYTSDHRANHPSQNLGPVCYATGFIDAMTVKTIRAGLMDGVVTKPWLSPEERAVDLDTPEDWAAAEALARAAHWGPGIIL